jgi:integrase
VVSELGVPVAALATDPPESPMPTLAEYVPRARAAATPGTRVSYGPYWQRAIDHYGSRRLDEITPSDILALQRHVVATVRPRRSGRGGRHAGEHLIRALRNLYRLAVQDELLPARHNPALAVPLPRRLPSTRRALSAAELAEINQVVEAGGRDPALDTLLIRLHLETACRRGGALALRLEDLDTRYCRVLLREKGGTYRWQPITPTLTAALADHAAIRRADRPADTLLRYANGTPLSARRYDLLWMRVRTALPWAAQLGVSTHWLRHTTITWVERHFGYAVARAYAGHTDSRSGSTLTYIRGLPTEVAIALTALTGEPHPLATIPRNTAISDPNVPSGRSADYGRRASRRARAEMPSMTRS